MTRRDEIRHQALRNLQEFEVLMLGGHFDYGNGYHGRVYLNPHQIFRQPSTIWRFAQDLLDVIPADLLAETEVVAGPVMGGALLAHTIAGLLDGRRNLTHPPCLFAPFTVEHARTKRRGAEEPPLASAPGGVHPLDFARGALSAVEGQGTPPMVSEEGGFVLRRFYARMVAGRKVLIADDVRNTGKTYQRCAALVQAAGGTVIATVQIYDRLESVVDLGVPNCALAGYRTDENYRVTECPMCHAGQPITAF